jgi:hypothetical protein
VTIVLSFATEVPWHEGHSMARALTRLGHSVRIVNTSAPPFDVHSLGGTGYAADARLTDVLAGTAPDYFIHIEPRGLLPLGLDRAPCRTVCFLCDTAVSLPPRQDLARLFDDVVLYHRDAMTAFQSHGRDRVYWSPFALDPAIHRDPGGARDLDVAYIGSLDGLWTGRRRLVERLAREWTMNDVRRRYSVEEAAATYGRARIVVNTCINRTINPRVFDAMGSGALLLNGDTPAEIEELFTPGVHFVAFSDLEDAAAKVRHYLSHEEERAAIARAGRDEVRARHTWDVRMTALMKTLAASPARGQPIQSAPARSMAPDDVEDIYHRRYKQAGHVEALLRRAAIHPRWSRRRALTLWRAAATAVSVFRRGSSA